MKLLLAFGIIVLFYACDHPGEIKQKTSDHKDSNHLADSTLAERFGADEYGMKQYVMAFLKTGPNRNHDSLTAAKIQRAHLDNIGRMAKDGKLVLAGPFMDTGEIRGIYIFNVKTIEEAELLTATDPAITTGRLLMELHPWYGSAALMHVNTLHKQISKKDI